MRTDGLNVNEQALFYMDSVLKRNYTVGVLLGFVISALALFGAKPEFSVLAAPCIGLLLAYLDNQLTVRLLARKPGVYAERLDWQLTMRQSLKMPVPFEPATRVRLLSSEGLRRYGRNLGLALIYESYKWLLILLAAPFSFAVSGSAESGMLTWGLSIFFCGVFYLVLWSKKYFRKSAEALQVPAERIVELRNHIKRRGF